MRRHAMVAAAAAALGILLMGCASRHAAVQCPHVRQYNDAELDAIQKSIDSLAKNDPLRAAMHDYEDLRDEARSCVAENR
jgi:hypothetical protein